VIDRRNKVHLSMQRYGRKSIAVALMTAALLSSSAMAAIQTLSPQEEKLLDDFAKNAKTYMDKERALPADKLKPKSDIELLEKQRAALRDAVRQSRPDAKQGDFFTPSTATVFRKVLARTMAGPDGAKVRASLKHAEPEAPMKFVVNGDYPNRQGQPIQSMPPTMLQSLPPLPKGLEYSIAGNTLALRDTTANLVVDFLPDALP
jgi:hypothetical protein